MQWMTMTSVVPCHALHALQYAAASPFGPLNQSHDFPLPQLPKQILHNWNRQIQICRFLFVELRTPRWIPNLGL